MKLKINIKDPLDTELRKLESKDLALALVPLLEAVIVDLKNGKLTGQWINGLSAHWHLQTLEME